MKTFAELESLDMKWVKGKRPNLFKPNPYQLTAENGQVLATITPGNRATKATVDAPGNRWTFERKNRRPQVDYSDQVCRYRRTACHVHDGQPRE
ncbi:MAG: hypothetical protein U0670_11010 [Anaerolineae bacterium]